jgi:hypothetical protein
MGPERHVPSLHELLDVMKTRLRILITKAPRDAVNLWIVACFLACALLVVLLATLPQHP